MVGFSVRCRFRSGEADTERERDRFLPTESPTLGFMSYLTGDLDLSRSLLRSRDCDLDLSRPLLRSRESDLERDLDRPLRGDLDSDGDRPRRVPSRLCDLDLESRE
jgi:hypothetical protein